MNGMKHILAVTFVLVLLTASWHILKVTAEWLMTPVVETDRTADMPSLPNVAFIERLRLATGSGPSSAVWLICSAGPHVRLVLNTRLPIESAYLENGAYNEVHARIARFKSLTIEDIRNSPPVKTHGATLRRNDESDVLLTAPLSDDAIALLTHQPAAGHSDIVRIDALETGTTLRWNADSEAISKFAKQCIIAK